MREETRRLVDRRSFLQTAGLAAVGIPLAHALGAASPLTSLAERLRRSPVRVRGIVRADGKGLGRVAVSDGRNVVATGADGTFELPSDSLRPFVFISLPAGMEIPLSPRGSANHFLPLMPNASGEATAEFNLKRSAVSDDRHAFMLLADPQTLDMDDMKLFHETTIPDIRNTVAGLTGIPVFGVGCGDLMFDRLALFPEYERGVQMSGIPFFQVLGNHDVDAIAKSDEHSAATFLKTFGPTNYSFNRGSIHYVVLDDVMWLGDGYIGYLHQEQLDWLEDDLSFIEKGQTVVVFVHIPVYSTQHARIGQKRPERGLVVANRAALYEILAPFKSQIIAGHMHEIEHAMDGGIETHVVGAVCGAWWSGPICGDGTPNGYGIFEANGGSLQWRYKGTGLPLSTQMRLYAPGSDPAAPSELIANVWDWDKSWGIVWFEDGIRTGAMKQTRGTDPLSVELHSGPQLPKKHSWVEPYVTDHLFRAAISPGTKEVAVEATDRFGRVHVDRLTLRIG